jgi:hypothetical protein
MPVSLGEEKKDEEIFLLVLTQASFLPKYDNFSGTTY